MKIELISVFLIALLMDRLLGEPDDWIHPTVFMGKTIDYLNKKGLRGILILLIVSISFPTITYLVLILFEGYAKILLGATIFKTTFSWRGLKEYTVPIARDIEKEDIKGARKRIPFIAGRDPGKLDKEGILSTTVESISEGSVDGVISPFFYFYIFSFLGMEAGVGGAVFYRTVNTLDSMIGRPENAEGYYPAKVDEILNFFPSRMGAALIIFSSAFLGKDFRRGLSVFQRDRNKTTSKNAGQTMSAIAGVLGVNLKKEGAYSLGDKKVNLDSEHVYEALRVVDGQLIVASAMVVVTWL